MNKRDIQQYFDRRAADWDSKMVRSDAKIAAILDAAGVHTGSRVLDVACGTGVLFPDYLQRGASRVTGVDISPEMIRVARGKFRDPRVELFCTDIEELEVEQLFDCCVVYNAFPHFVDPVAVIVKLALLLRPGGRLCIAHGMSRRQIIAHHSGKPSKVSQPLQHVETLADWLDSVCEVDTVVSDDEKYIVAGARRAAMVSDRLEKMLQMTSGRQKTGTA